jgi:hypothetical protein
LAGEIARRNGGKNEITENEVVQWVRAHPDIEQKIWPDRHWLTPEEKDEAVNQILGISDDYEITGPGHRPSSTPAETPALAGEGDPGDDANPPENPAQSD